MTQRRSALPGMAASSAQPGDSRPGEPHRESRTTEGDTRRQVMLLLLQDGPVTATYLGKRLGLSAAGIRRHLDNLVEEDLAEVAKPRPRTHPGESAGRGRPAKQFRLTDRGRAQFGHAYDELASEALDALREAAGPDAVKHFARARFERLVAGVGTPPASLPPEERGKALEETAQQLAQILQAHGYATTVSRAGQGVQLCQHHCPVASVAAAHPELCEAEQEVFSALLGTHVQPLASIADGHGICTTNIPLTPVGPAADRRRNH